MTWKVRPFTQWATVYRADRGISVEPLSGYHRIVQREDAHEARQTIERSPAEEGEYVGRFEANRAEFEAIASEKFDHGRFDGTILISSDDLMKIL
jgi:hypothetical protein